MERVGGAGIGLVVIKHWKAIRRTPTVITISELKKFSPICMQMYEFGYRLFTLYKIKK